MCRRTGCAQALDAGAMTRGGASGIPERMYGTELTLLGCPSREIGYHGHAWTDLVPTRGTKRVSQARRIRDVEDPTKQNSPADPDVIDA